MALSILGSLFNRLIDLSVMPFVSQSRSKLLYAKSDHSYWWQNFEYKYALSKLNPGGYLFSDDIDYSTAWAKFAPFNFSRNIVLFDFRKLIGVARNGAN